MNAHYREESRVNQTFPQGRHEGSVKNNIILYLNTFAYKQIFLSMTSFFKLLRTLTVVFSKLQLLPENKHRPFLVPISGCLAVNILLENT